MIFSLKTKRLTAIILTVCVAAGLVSALTLNAAASSLVSVTETCDYTIKTVNVGLPHYRDAVGEEKLFDGVIPTTEELNDAVQKAIDDGAEESLQGWFQWKGWIGIHSTGSDSYKINSAVDVNFAFDEAVELKKIVVHCAAMEKGNVFIPSNYEIYLSEDGKSWSTTPVIAQPTEYKNGEAVNNVNAFDDTVIILDEAVNTKYFKLVANGVGCWWFCSEVEIYEENSVIIDVEDSSEASSEPVSSETTAEPTDTNNLASGKTYTLSETTLRNDNRDDDGTKLTDGVKIRDNTGGALIAGFLTKNLEVVIDLEKVSKIAGFNADALGYNPWGIPSPSLFTVEYLYSSDGTTFTSAGTVAGSDLTPVYGDESNWVAYEFNKDIECEARYVKVIYTIPEENNGHLWISEIEVYNAEEAGETSNDTSDGGTPITGDTGLTALAIFAVIALAGAAFIKRK